MGTHSRPATAPEETSWGGRAGGAAGQLKVTTGEHSFLRVLRGAEGSRVPGGPSGAWRTVGGGAASFRDPVALAAARTAQAPWQSALGPSLPLVEGSVLPEQLSRRCPALPPQPSPQCQHRSRVGKSCAETHRRGAPGKPDRPCQAVCLGGGRSSGCCPERRLPAPDCPSGIAKGPAA